METTAEKRAHIARAAEHLGARAERDINGNVRYVYRDEEARRTYALDEQATADVGRRLAGEGI